MKILGVKCLYLRNKPTFASSTGCFFYEQNFFLKKAEITPIEPEQVMLSREIFGAVNLIINY